MENSPEILWPEFNHPKFSTIHDRNQLNMAASAESAWACLIHATRWPEWYSHASDEVMHEENGTKL